MMTYYPSDKELEAIARAAEVQNMIEQGGLTGTNDVVFQQLNTQRLAGLRAIWRTALESVPPDSNQGSESSLSEFGPDEMPLG